MDYLKRSVKKILMEQQHKAYKKEVEAKNLNYDSWIRQQEKNLPIDNAISLPFDRCLINDWERVQSGRDKVENGGNPSKFDEDCHILEFVSDHGQRKEKKQYLLVSAELFGRKMEDFMRWGLPEVLLLRFYPGTISKFALGLIDACFRENENLPLVYGDEDVCRDGVRVEPWLKPDWSPDRFLSCFYFGGLAAVRTEALRDIYMRCRADGVIEAWYHMAEQTKEDGRGLLYFLFYDLLQEEKGYKKRTEKGKIPAYHIRQVLYHSEEAGYEQIKDMKLPSWELEKRKYNIQEKEKSRPLLSVIIPSKDNPAVLFHCLDSLVERTRSNCAFELILVDNGSCEENRREIEDRVKLLSKRSGEREGNVRLTECRYLYQPMDFNFSRMCNLGAENAKGEVLLFLNDDMEIICPQWMDIMLENVLWDYAGAVGAKLLYPDSDVIQHAGITNLRVGPAHKLQFLHDETDHYYGMNRGAHNMLGVTGACLMVRREVFEEAGGFWEELAVAFNDVDLCYTIYEHGYYNMVRNDVVFYHHESLSRGKDGESSQKQLRLLREKDLLYQKHQALYGRDPYYHPYLTTDMLESEYSPACRYQVTLEMPWSEAVPGEREMQRAREDKCLVVGMECAMDIYKWKYGVSWEVSQENGKEKMSGEDMGYYFQGYSFVIGSDNACYKRKLLLKNQEDQKVWMIAVEDCYRKDIRDNLKDQLNVDLTGFTAKLRRKAIPAGVYQFGMLVEDRCSRQRLVNWSNWVLEVGTDGK